MSCEECEEWDEDYKPSELGYYKDSSGRVYRLMTNITVPYEHSHFRGVQYMPDTKKWRGEQWHKSTVKEWTYLGKRKPNPKQILIDTCFNKLDTLGEKLHDLSEEVNDTRKTLKKAIK